MKVRSVDHVALCTRTVHQPTSTRSAPAPSDPLMGGFAAIVDWERPIEPAAIERMLTPIPHRATGGTAHTAFRHAALGEARTEQGDGSPSVTTRGRFSIVGDLRLWNRQSLESRAGGRGSASGLDDRELLLAAYARTGIGFLDDVDGDFAFVIWDNERHRILAVRDRFAVKPLFFEPTPTGVRFATEQKQLLATTVEPVRPNDRAVAEFLTNRYREPRNTFFAGISSVGPAQYVLAEPARLTRRSYWAPPYGPTALTNESDIVEQLRDELTLAVERRASTSVHTIAHLTGGLDSSSITAAASEIATNTGRLPPFETVSAIFPGFDGDEALWIDEIVGSQPFPHHSFEPAEETIEQFEEVIWETDGPLHNRVRNLWPDTAGIAKSVGADLVLMGSGGDEVLDQDQLLPDLLRRGLLSRWSAGTRAEASWFGISRALSVERSLRLWLPPWFKDPLRGLVNRPNTTVLDLIDTAFLAENQPPGLSADPPLASAPSLTQHMAVASTREARRVLTNENQEAEFAYRGIGVSYPYLDRSLVDFVTSLPPALRPFDGSTKTLVRSGFAGRLPASVLDRRSKSVANDYLDQVFTRLGAVYRLRYPTVTHAATAYLSSERYERALEASDSNLTTRPERTALWNVWTLMLWLDGFARYRTKT